MKESAFILFLFVALNSCSDDAQSDLACDIHQAYTVNKEKVTISNGVWGTVSFLEGDCMPGPAPRTCKHCPVKRVVRIYEYTLISQAVRSVNSYVFFYRFNTQLVKELETDDLGFFQADLPPGQYTLVVVESGKLYASGGDGKGGINPVTIDSGAKNADLQITYRAVF